MKKKSLFRILSGNTKKGKKNKEAVPAAPDFNPEAVYPKLYIQNPDQFEEEDVYILKYKHGKLEPMKENQLQLQTYETLLIDDTHLAVRAFIRHSVRAEIQLENASVVLRDEKENSLLKQTFLLEDLGALPPLSAVPYEFIFDISALPDDKKQHTEKWSIGFELQSNHQLVYDASWEDKLTEEQRNYFQMIFDQNPKAPAGNLNFMLVNAQRENENIHVTIMIQNGKDQSVEISQLPLLLLNAEEQTIAQGTFRMDRFSVPANASKPWIFVFPKDSVLMADAALEQVKLKIAQ